MSELETIIGEAIRWRRRLHRYPETGFDERLTSEYVAKRLDSFGIEVHRGVGGTGVVGTLRVAGGDRAIALRADLDALAIRERNRMSYRSRVREKMHACGHDGHTAMLLGAAKWLARTRAFRGTLHFIFQPAEEHGRGAQAMLADGLLERFPMDEIYGLHNVPGLPVGTFATRTGSLTASEDNFEIRVMGTGGHAARPNHLSDPVVAAAEVVVALQTIVARKIDPVASAVVSVTEIVTDGARNVIPATVTLKGDTRSFLPAVQKQIESAMKLIVQGVCSAHGCRAELDYTHEFRPTINTEAATVSALRAAREVFTRIEASCEPVMGSEDFAQLLSACGSGNFALVGNTPIDATTSADLHSPLYDFNDEALQFGVRYWIRLAEQQLPRSP